jgi:tagatose 1,6-diphosphate aldolase
MSAGELHDVEFLKPGPLIDDDLELVLSQTTPANPGRGWAPAYHFEMRRRGWRRRRMGRISLRIANTRDIVMYIGHIGYRVAPRWRGHRYAARSCRLLLPLAAAHDLVPMWITCNPDNIASRRTCEILGAELVEIVPVPPYMEMFHRGETEKCRYRIDPRTAE